MPCTSCTRSPCRTGLGGLLTSSWCLGRQEPHVTWSCRGSGCSQWDNWECAAAQPVCPLYEVSSCQQPRH